MRILVAEPDHDAAMRLQRRLASEGYEVVWARSARDVSAVLGQQPLAAAVLDLPQAQAAEICSALRQVGDQTPVLLLGSDELSEKLRAFRSGADGYLSHPIALDELAAFLERLMHRQLAHDQQIRYGRLKLDLIRRCVWWGAQELCLTRREFDILARLTKSGGAFVGRGDLIRSVWGGRPPCDNGLSTHLCRLRQCFAEAAATVAIESARELGVRLILTEDRRAGGRDFSAPSHAWTDLSARLDRLADRITPAPPDEDIAAGPLRIDRVRRRADYGGRPLKLTPHEVNLLACLALQPGEIVPKNDLELAVWGQRGAPSDNALSTLLGRLRRYLNTLRPPPHLQTVRSIGYILMLPEEPMSGALGSRTVRAS